MRPLQRACAGCVQFLVNDVKAGVALYPDLAKEKLRLAVSTQADGDCVVLF